MSRIELLRDMYGKCFASAALALMALSCDPKPIQVTTTTDGGAGSLRAAIDAANRVASGAVRIELPAGTYTLTRCGTDDTNVGGDLDITTNAAVTLSGTGPGVVIRQTCAGDRLLDARGSGLLTVSGVTLSGGSGVVSGGALAAAADATLTASILEGNAAVRSGGGAFVAGKLTLVDSRITNNRLSNPIESGPFAIPGPVTGAGVYAGTVDARNSSIDANVLYGCIHDLGPAAGVSGGGGISATRVSLVNTTLTGNSGAPCSVTPFQRAAGIAVAAAELTLDHVTIAGNTEGTSLAVSRLVTHASLLETTHDACSPPVTPTQGSYNWFTDTTCGLTGSTNQQERAPFLLGELADNGGPVPTRLPALGSVLLNRIPVASCVQTQDARGVTRPQGSGCDIGAVEVAAPAGGQATDFALAFTGTPSALTPGNEAIWTLTVTNRGPSRSPVAVTASAPAALRINAAGPSDGGHCEIATQAVCNFLDVPVGANRTITLWGDLAEPSTAPLLWNARVDAPELRPPFTDDRATLTTPVLVNGSVRMSLSTTDRRLLVSLTSAGPFAAVGTPSQPISVTFQPAAGVRVESAGASSFVGIFDPRGLRIGEPRLRLAFDGPPPAVLGTLQLHPGPNAVSGPATLTVNYVRPPDLDVRAFRATSAPGSPITFTVEVRNVGGGVAQRPELELRAPTGANLVYEPSAGAVLFQGLPVWYMPELAPGAKHTLQVTATGTVRGNVFVGTARLRDDEIMDPNAANDQVTLDLSPAVD
ncbi:MAG TPA: choice-of-anchor Q domain-containing protein [Polyangiaceae bacterium]|nr:choice-of-anchor Q domain-containing protein [Polyangiaceae bacterium]